MASRTEFLAAIAAGALVLVLTGCGAGAADPSASGAAAETVASVEPSAPATDATVDPPAAAAGCDTVLTDAEYARLSDEGHELEAEPFLLGPVMERMADAGALVCVWTKPNSDVAVWYARLEVGDEGQAWLDQLQAEGWVEDTERGDGTYLAPADYDSNYQPSVQLESGVLHFGSYNPILQEVLELQ
ncbi:hypothetical protein ACFCVO_12225 [Agromyces sp. NPDC056379]|uniref:hypothetical protein n=1 Tax=unclassified Agromyces TaxID=2639701 RepID=UPI0035E2B51A